MKNKRFQNSKKKAQVSIEFMMLFTTLLFFFIIFSVIIKENIEKKDKEREEIILQSLALDIQYEINLAGEASNGYSREFNLPENVLGKDYQINISENRISLSTDYFRYVYTIVNITGTLKKGINVIRKNDEKVFIN